MAPESPTKGDWVAWIGTYDELLRSTSEGYRVRLMDNTDPWDAAYPGLVRLPDGSIVTTTYGHWTIGAPPWIVNVQLQPAVLDRTLRHLLPSR